MKAVIHQVNNSVDEIRNTILKANNIAVSAHTSPDGDAVGASCALGMALKKIGKNVKVSLEKYPEVFNVMPAWKISQNSLNDFNPDLYIAVDCGDIDRLGNFKCVYESTQVTINIDHHKSNTYFGNFNYVDSKASSSSEIIYRIIHGFSPLDSDIAACIYSGIISDTGGFRHTSTSSETFIVASELIKYNFDFSKIYNTIFNTRSFGEAKALGMALDNMQETCDGKIVYSYLNIDYMAKCGINSYGVSEIVGYIKGIKDCETAIFIYEKSAGVFKVSMRSDESVDVCEVAVKFGGGGHAKASGFTIAGNLSDIIYNVIFELNKQL